METTELKERFIELRAKGWSFDKIAKETGKAKQTLIDWSKELQDEIGNRKALELEALYDGGCEFAQNGQVVAREKTRDRV